MNYGTNEIFEVNKDNLNKSANWHCGCHTLIKKNVVNHDM